MNHFTIKDIEHLTGIKSHTLRIWEQRYGIPHPKRTATNIRYYDDEDLKLLLNVSLLNRQGHKISRLTSLSKEELEKLVLSYSSNVNDTSIQIDTMMQAMFNLDEGAFDRILSSHLMKFGLERTMLDLFFPFLKRIGVLWQTGQVNPAFEHFMSNLIRQKIIVAIDSQSSVLKTESKKFILFLPESEIHELGLLFANYAIRARGHKTIYLGQNLPYTDLDAIVDQYNCDFIMSVLTSTPTKNSPQVFVNNLSSRFKNRTILLTGIQITSNQAITAPSNVRFLPSFDSFIAFIESL
ncbi:MAG TPA: MerR family transcriptional regulator [Bacteroidia bacterium]|mgnify:CR=1 FL=1|nr:MerR family transcriptional regulator [Bacteroidia bacterium]